MWDQTSQQRPIELQEEKTHGTLTSDEEAELSRLIEERSRFEEARILAVARQSKERAAHLGDRIEQVQSQNRELESLRLRFAPSYPMCG
jgi:hypothetical protein